LEAVALPASLFVVSYISYADILQCLMQKIFTKKTFYGDSGPYLTIRRFVRVVINRVRWDISIHQFHRGDEDPDCHCHPFHFWSFVLYGGYREYFEDGTFIDRKAFSKIVYREATFRHRVELLGQSCWTICLKKDASRDWGFYPGGVFVHWKEYISNKSRDILD